MLSSVDDDPLRAEIRKKELQSAGLKFLDQVEGREQAPWVGVFLERQDPALVSGAAMGVAGVLWGIVEERRKDTHRHAGD